MQNRTFLIDRIPTGGTWFELGVASARFGNEVCSRRSDFRYIGVDRWSDHHNEDEMRKARSLMSKFNHATLVRNSFEEVAKTVPNDSCDAVYIDGYAHTGQDNGRTLEMWWPKIKRGGFMCGHDYDLGKWPGTFKAVNYFAGHRGLKVEIVHEESGYASWVINRPIVDKSLLDGKCILVGNGPSMKGSGLGSLIDGYDEVVRFNDYQIDGFESDVGSKATIWSCYGKNAQRERCNPPLKVIYLHGATDAPSWYDPEEVWRIPVSFYEQVRDEVRNLTDKDKSKILPSAGLVVVRWMLDYHLVRSVDIVGFDHFSKKSGSNHHYWLNRSFTDPVEHDGLVESKLFAEMEDFGRVRFV